MISPRKYIQGEGELNNFGKYIKLYGNKVLLVASKDDQKRVQDQLDEAQRIEPFEIVFGEFNEESTKKEIARLEALMNTSGCNVVAGLGGGKALDTAKAVSFLTGKPSIIVPTIASTDAPCSSLAIIYNEKSEFEGYMNLERNPDIVLVDTGIIAKAPVRFLVSGMGDALSTYFEARACARSYAKNIPGGMSTKAAMAIAKQCFDTLMEDSLKAKAACEARVVTQALENIIEANVLLSGIGFESSGLAAAHAIHDGLTVLEETHKYYHGEKVAFGVLVHLVLENAQQSEINQIISYCKSVGLPTCLKDIGIVPTEEKIMKVAKAAVAEGETIHNMPFEVTAQDVYSAILTADKLGG